MKKHEILSPQSRAELFDPPTDPAAIVRQYTFSLDDFADCFAWIDAASGQKKYYRRLDLR